MRKDILTFSEPPARSAQSTAKMPSSKEQKQETNIMASVGIIGAGIGGLTAATALRQKGFVVRVYEQASQFIPKAGAGFGFSPNGQVCLKSLGIETRNLIHPFDKLVHLSKEGTLKAESDILRQMRQRHGFGIGGCLRADLVDTLKESLDDKDSILQYSHKLVNMTQDDDRVCLQFENGKKQEHDFVIGADGIHSSVASILDIDQSPPIYSDANIFYGVIEKPDEALLKEIGLEPHAIVQGNNIGEFITFPAGPEERLVQVWAATYPSSEAPLREEWGVVEPASTGLQAILDQFVSMHPIHALSAHTTPDRLLHFGLFYRKHKDKWHKGRTVLLGDSCHATLPHVGQGANQAIEDAIVLADCLATEKDYNAAFESYYQQRNKRTRRIVNMATIMNTLHHTQNPILVKARDFLINRILQGKTMLKMLEKEIVEECPVKDYAKYS